MDNKSTGKVEMPVGMAMAMALRSDAIDAFESLTEERKREYIRRARAATSADEMRSVVADIVKIG